MKMAIYLCRKFFRSERADEDKLLEDIARYVEPIRPGRRDERNLKAKSFVTLFTLNKFLLTLSTCTAFIT